MPAGASVRRTVLEGEARYLLALVMSESNLLTGTA